MSAEVLNCNTSKGEVDEDALHSYCTACQCRRRRLNTATLGCTTPACSSVASAAPFYALPVAAATTYTNISAQILLAAVTNT